MRTYQADLTFLPNVVGTMINFMVSSKRIIEFMLVDKIQSIKCQIDKSDEYDLIVQHIGFSHPIHSKETVQKSDNSDHLNENLIDSESKIEANFELKSLNFEIKKGELVALIGQSGSGKSSLFNALIGELIPQENENSVFFKNANLSFVSQSPWIINESIKNNIIMNKVYDHQKFIRILELSNLKQDINEMKNGFETIIGSKGTDISGGQKVRIAIARSLYSDTDMYFYDDVLSAFDGSVSDDIFNKVICNLLKSKTRILSTHNISNLNNFDRIIFLEKGIIVFNGVYSDLVKLYKFDVLKQIEESVKTIINDNQHDNTLDLFVESTSDFVQEQKSNNLFTNNHHDTNSTDKNNNINSNDQNNKNDDNINTNDIHNNHHNININDINNNNDNDINTNNIQNNENNVNVKDINTPCNNKSKNKFLNFLYQNMNEEVNEKQILGVESLKYYIKIGSVLLLILSIVFELMFSCVNWYSYIFYNKYSKTDEQKFDFYYFFKTLSIIQILSTVLPTLRGFTILMFGLSVSKKLSTLMNFRLIHAPIGGFYQSNSSGKIMNRLSGDLEMVDRNIPVILSQQINQSFFVILQFVLMVYYSSPYLIVFVSVFGVLIYKTQRNFVEKLKQVTKLDLVSKSPFFNHFGDTIYGLMDIRILKLETFFRSQMEEIIDNHIKCGYLLTACYKWFRLRISLLSLIFMIPCCCFLTFGNEETVESIPVVLFVLIQNIEYFINFINTTNETEKSMVGFGRCDNYTKLPTEKNSENIFNYTQLMRSGVSLEQIQVLDSKIEKINIKDSSIKFINVSAQYKHNSNQILKNLSFEIQEHEKIGIVGRTGAGKSSIIKLMMNFIDYPSGEINISGVDIFTVNPKLLRSNISYISQETHFFEASFRENLDMFGSKKDIEILELLRESGMLDKVNELGGLDGKIVKNGENLSVGERQILSFVRTIINLKSIVVLDEATSSMDVKSEETLEKMKKKYFEFCTVLSIAHRLNTLYDCDRIIVIENGRLKNIIRKDAFQLRKHDLSLHKQ